MDSDEQLVPLKLSDLQMMMQTTDAPVPIVVSNKDGKVVHEGKVTNIFGNAADATIRICCHRGMERTMTAQYMGIVLDDAGRLDGELLTFLYSPLYGESDYKKAFETNPYRALAAAL